MKKSHLLLLTGLLALPFCNVYAANVEEDVKLAEGLIRLNLFDLTENYLNQQLAAAKGAEQDLYKISLASLFYIMKKDKEAKTWIDQIPATSPYYDRAQKVAGVTAYNTGAYDDATKMFENYLSIVMARYKDKAPTVEQIQQIEGDLAYLLTIYKEAKPNHEGLMNVMRAQATLREKLQAKWLADNEDTDESMPPEANAGDIQLFICKFSLDIYEKEKNATGKVDVPKVNMILKDIQNLLWKDEYVRASAAAQGMRALTILGKFDEAEKMKSTYEGAAEVADQIAGEPEYSPRGPFRFYTGNIYLQQAKTEKDPEKQAVLLQKALSAFYACAKFHFRFELAEALVNSLDEASDMFVAIGKSVPSAVTEANPEVARWYVRDAITTEARRLYQEKKYKEAIPELLKGYANSPCSDMSKDALFYLFTCYTKKEPVDLFEATIVAKTLGDRFPKSDMTAAAYMTTGTLAAVASKDLPAEDPMKFVLNDESMDMYSGFLKLFPTHEQAPQLAYKLAHDYYKIAQGFMRQGNAAKGDERAALFEKGREAYLLAADKFNLVINKFAQKEKFVIESWYFLGMCYTSALEYEKAIVALEKFVSLEKKDFMRLSNAQFSIATAYYDLAEALYKQYKPLEVKASEYSEVPSELAAEIATLKDSAKKDYLKAAEAFIYYTGDFANKVLRTQTEAIKERLAIAKIMIAWSYDGANEKAKAINAFKNFIAAQKPEKVETKENPKAYSRMAILYTELKDVANAATALKSLNEKYPKSPEAKSALFILGRSMYNIENYEEAIKAFNEMLDNAEASSVAAMQFVLKNMIVYQSSAKPVTPEMASVAVRAGEKLLTELQKPKLSDWVSKSQAKALGNGKSSSSKTKIENTLYPIKEAIWLNLARAYTLADDGKNGMAQKAVQTYTNLIKPPKANSAKKGEAKYVSPYLFDALTERGAAYAKAGNPVEGHKDLYNLQTILSNMNRFDLMRKAIVKDADIYIADKDYKGAQRVLQNIVIGEKLNVAPAVDYPPDATLPQKQKIDAEAKERFDEQMKWTDEGAYKYIYCSAKLGDKEAVDTVMKKYKEAFPKGRYTVQLNNLPEPEGQNKP